MSGADLIAAAIANRQKRLGQVATLRPLVKGARERASQLSDARKDVKDSGRRVEFVRSMHHVPGFFPTPPALVARMIEAAELKPGMACLEPSAGTGNIAKAILRAGISAHTLQCIEVVSRLAETLAREGLATRCADFLAYEVGQKFDRVLMNPPFEKRQDEAHIKHAFKFLRPGGRLVAVCTAMTAARLSVWVSQYGHTEKLPEGAFKNSERSTGVHTALIILNSPA